MHNHKEASSFLSLGNTAGLYLGLAFTVVGLLSDLLPFTGPNDLNFIISPKQWGNDPPLWCEGQQLIKRLLYIPPLNRQS